MVVQIAMGVTQFILFVASLGTAPGNAAEQAAADKEIAQAMERSSGTLNKALTYFKTIANNPAVRNAMMQRVMFMVTRTLMIHAAADMISLVCKAVGNAIFNSASSSIKFSPTMLDPTGIADAVSACDNTSDPNYKIYCAQSIMDVVSMADPTGIVCIAAALVQPVCDV